MTGNLKQLISVRLSAADLTKIRTIAECLDTRDSEVFRFALRLAFAHLGPLHDRSMNANAAISLFLEHGTELIRHFDLDADAIDGIVNRANEKSTARVAREDIEMLAMLGLPEQYMHTQLHATGKLDMNATEGTPKAVYTYLRRKYLLQPHQGSPALEPVHAETSAAKLSFVPVGEMGAG